MHSAGEALRSPFMISESHVGVIFKYSAISDFAPRGSVLKYSVNVMSVLCKVGYSLRPADTALLAPRFKLFGPASAFPLAAHCNETFCCGTTLILCYTSFAATLPFLGVPMFTLHEKLLVAMVVASVVVIWLDSIFWRVV